MQLRQGEDWQAGHFGRCSATICMRTPLILIVAAQAGGVRGKRMGLVTWRKSGSPRKAQEHLEKRSTPMTQLLKSAGIIEINLSDALI